ncbi:KaiC domain-containing protein [Halorussus salinisoli]|uniref:KaiC domain-containing protein n=1 Tax=Halorussus salinisoli TaxID=2558242 RepID=UPI002A915CF5|nr:KaiC domain-containing protein [Halorussus salinisoli]
MRSVRGARHASRSTDEEVAPVTEDDDWFERALREDEGDDGSADEESATVETEATDSKADGTEPGETGATDAELPETEPADGPGGFGDSPANDPPADTPATDEPPADDSPSGGFADADPYDDDEVAEDDELFDEDFASAFDSAPGGGPEPAGGGGPASGGDAGGDFGAGGGGDFGMDTDEGFGGGFGDGEPFESEEFDDEEFESSIPRIDIGIEGLDSMIQGGVPERSLVTTIGSAGTGKTTFGLQFLHEALEAGENAVFITLEESHDRIVNTATEKGWAFDEYEEEGQLAVIDLDPIEMANSLTSIRNDLPRLVEQFGATRLVLDSVSLLEMMYDEQSTRRNEVYDFTKSLKEAGVTTMLTSEASEDNAYASRHGIIEYLVDAVFILRYIRSTDDFRETRLAVEIQKIRDANHSREIKPYSITNEGISVYRQANIF